MSTTPVVPTGGASIGLPIQNIYYPATVDVFYEGGIYFFVDWRNRRFDSDPDFATVTNAAIVYGNALGGALVHIATCPAALTFYLVTVAIILLDGILLEGEGWMTVLRNADATRINVIEILLRTDAQVRDLAIDGNRDNNPDVMPSTVLNGILLDGCTRVQIINVYIYDVVWHALYFLTNGTASYYCRVQGCICNHIQYDGFRSGWDVIESWFLDNLSVGCGNFGCYFSRLFRCSYKGNINVDAGSFGHRFGTAYDCNFVGNYAAKNADDGFYMDGCHSNNFVGNTSNNNGNEDGMAGLLLKDSEYNTIACNNLQGRMWLEGVGWRQLQDYGLLETGTSDHNRIFNNDLRFNDTLPAVIVGVNDELLSIPFQFTEPLNTTFSTTSPTGFSIIAADDTAIACGQISDHIQQIIRIKIWAVALGAPAAAGGQMHLEITFNAGASNAAYNTATKSWGLTNFDSEEADYVANDVVHWVILDGDVGNELQNLAIGDSFEIFAIYEGEVSPDGETNARLRVVEIEYV